MLKKEAISFLTGSIGQGYIDLVKTFLILQFIIVRQIKDF